MKRLHSDMQSHDRAAEDEELSSSSSSSSPPKSSFDAGAGQYIVIRNHVHSLTQLPIAVNSSQTRATIFSSWEDGARDYIARMPNNSAEYETFERANDALNYAFGKETENNHRPLFSTPPAGSHDPEPCCSLSFLEQLPQDTLNDIYSHLCGHSFELAFKFISESLGMVSKAVYQSCINFVQQVPITVPLVARRYMYNPEMLSFFLQNKARVRELAIGCDKSSDATFCLFLFMIRHLDISSMKTLDLRHFTTSKSSAEEKWNLVRRGALPVWFVDKGVTITSFYEDISQVLVSEATSLVNLQLLLGYNEKYRWKQLLLLKTIRHQLEELSLHFYDSNEAKSSFNEDDILFYQEFHDQIMKMPRLKVFKSCSSWHVDSSFPFASQSLEKIELRDFEELGGSLFVDSGLDCPSLKFLGMKVLLNSSFNPSLLTKGCSFQTIEEVEIGFDSLGQYHDADNSSMMKQTLEVLGQMPRLKQLKISFECNNGGPVRFCSTSVEEFTAHIFIQDLRLEVKSLSMKIVNLTFVYFTEINPSVINIPNVEDLTIRSELDIEYDQDVVDAKLEILSRNIEKKMPNLRSLVIHIGEIPNAKFKLKSKSIKEATLSILHGKNVEVDCPSLEMLNGEPLNYEEI